MAKKDSQKQPAEQKPRPAHLFKPGQSGNPGGKPAGTRNRLQGDFMRVLSEDFAAHGKEAIEDCRTQNPAAYIKAIASLMPKELEIKRPLEGLSDDELDSAIALLRDKLASARGPGAGASHTPSAEQARGVQTLQ